MLVLGYASTTSATAPCITVPPFHTGHLGFVPGTPVRIAVVNATTRGRHCELMVTPFEQDFRDLALVTVVMHDRPGAVADLVEAVAVLGINIEVQESSSINLLDYHAVSLLVNMSGVSPALQARTASPSSVPTAPTSVRRLYHEYGSVFPVQELDFVHLFESIVAHCADVISWKDVSPGQSVPDIEIRGYAQQAISKFVIQPVVADDRMHVRIDLPDAITLRLRSVLRKDSQYEYLLVSDTTTRALHVFFLHPDLSERMFHAGFFHDDVPGALATILSLLRDAQFNIVTSLMRKGEDGRSVWEAVIEYQGEATVPPRGSRPAHSPVTEEELAWICERIVTAHKRTKRGVVDCGIELAPPKYPRPDKGVRIEPIVLRERLRIVEGNGTAPPYDPSALLQRQLEALHAPAFDHKDVGKTRELLKLIEKRHAEGERPGVFLSYPHSAKQHGEALCARLDELYRVELYQEPDGEVILEEVLRKIEGCDYFIGIWHHEGSPKEGSRTKDISPWMLFEYGVAHAAGKPSIVVHSNKLHEAIFRRISPGISNPEYCDFDFDPKTIDTVLEYCLRHFL
jgi:hypothetical protein